MKYELHIGGTMWTTEQYMNGRRAALAEVGEQAARDVDAAITMRPKGMVGRWRYGSRGRGAQRRELDWIIDLRPVWANNPKRVHPLYHIIERGRKPVWAGASGKLLGDMKNLRRKAGSRTMGSYSRHKGKVALRTPYGPRGHVDRMRPAPYLAPTFAAKGEAWGRLILDALNRHCFTEEKTL